jgi:hypothetical protein
MTRIALTDSERALARRRPDHIVYVGIVSFRGPRGRDYRPVRTAACVTLDAAEQAVTKIRGKQYRNGAFPIGYELVAVDHLGRVIA